MRTSLIPRSRYLNFRFHHVRANHLAEREYRAQPNVQQRNSVIPAVAILIIIALMMVESVVVNATDADAVFHLQVLWIVTVVAAIVVYYLIVRAALIHDPGEKSARERYVEAEYLRNAALSLWLPMLIFTLLFELLVYTSLASRPLQEILAVLNLQLWFGWIVGIVVLWGLTILVAISIYWYGLKKPLLAAKDYYEAEVRQDRAEHSEKQKQFLQEELQRLTDLSTRVMCGDKDAQDKFNDLITKSSNSIVNGKFDEAQSPILEANSMISREQNAERHRRKWHSVSILVIVVYIVAVSTVILSSGQPTQSNLSNIMEPSVPVLKIPLSVILWGALGSLAAILYRYFITQGQITLDNEVRWLIARPLVGIIMAALSFLALSAGVMLFAGGAATPSSDQSLIRFEIYLIVAFLAGFSDKFYEGMIKKLLATSSGDKTPSDEKDKLDKTDGPKITITEAGLTSLASALNVSAKESSTIKPAPSSSEPALNVGSTSSP